jgi:hypothetical protein
MPNFAEGVFRKKTENTVLIFHELPQGIAGIHSFFTKGTGFLLDANMGAGAQC